ncbi:group II intron reverse transcriptase/maturase [Terrimonas sp.]|uniref:group II intron reverse transcriptase/maturase n=1 Tax=Terrimonas sp. TaxID=1914338 RepID=UPI000D50930F|nr:group II intron reverse transcriptase/maturase [Terrimonas sp.]PVD49280.1 group II intron reverse transcriptase/maturase [Terrimonas sp.]
MTELFETKSKPVPITKDMVREAYRKVRSNKGSAGVDEVSLQTFDENVSKNLYRLWNRMASGSYFPMPVKEVIIPKSTGGERKLGIPGISDRIAQEVVKTYLEPRLEAVFLPQSYGYRPHRNAHQALEQVRENVRHYAWVIDMDIKSFFDEVNHELLMKAIDKHVPEKWVKMYIRRWLEAPVQTKDGLVFKKGQGTPQGGVISPLLANLFLHYVLDKWLAKTFPTVRFVRYADDVVVHCISEKQSHYVLEGIRLRLQECKLRLSEEKTKITYCQDYRRQGRKDYPKKFDFLGHTFKPMSKKSNRNNGVFLGYDCQMSMKSRTRIISEWKQMNFQRESTWTMQDLATLVNAKTRGIINYFGKVKTFSPGKLFRHLDYRIAKWVKNKFKRLHSYQKAYDWLRNIKSGYPNIFVHWSLSKI